MGMINAVVKMQHKNNLDYGMLGITFTLEVLTGAAHVTRYQWNSYVHGTHINQPVIEINWVCLKFAKSCMTLWRL